MMQLKNSLSQLSIPVLVCCVILGCAAGNQHTQQGVFIDETLEAHPPSAEDAESGNEYLPMIQKPAKSYARPIPDEGASTALSKSSSKSFHVEYAPIPVNRAQPVRRGKEVVSLGDKSFTGNNDSPEKGEAVTLNFDNADIYEVIRAMAEILKVNYIIDPSVQGNVTIHTAGSFSKKDLFAIFYQILDANGLSAIREGDIYRIGKSAESARRAIPLYLPSQIDPNKPGGVFGENIIMQIIPLKNIDGAEMAKLLTPFVSSEGTIVSHSTPNIIILVDKASNVNKALRLVESFDIDLLQDLKQKFYPLKYSNAEEVAKVLNEVLLAYGNDPKKNDSKLIAIARLNMLLVISSNPNVFRQMDVLVRKLDIPSEDVESRIYVYFVKNGEAEELAALLAKVFTGTLESKKNEIIKSDEEKKSANEPINPFAEKFPTVESYQKGSTNEQPAIEGPESGSKSVKGAIRVISDNIRNALIIDARPSDYQIVENILRRIDVLPRQVLIEATIAEVTLDDSTELGVEWSFDRANDNPTGLLTANIGESGLSYVIGLTDKWTQALNALAKNGKVNILSAPTVLASDNKQAQINVSTQIPLATTQFQYNATDVNPIFQTTIQYRNTGIILTVTPRINDRGLVSMDIRQEISDQAGGVNVGGQDYPSFFERVVETTLTVKDDQTIVLGGLITEKREQSDSGVPFFKDLPYLGYLFGKKSNAVNKTELIILLTPRVIVSLEDVDAVTSEFRTRVGDAVKFIR